MSSHPTTSVQRQIWAALGDANATATEVRRVITQWVKMLRYLPPSAIHAHTYL